MPETPLLLMRGIYKSYPGVQALCDVDLSLGRGETLGLVGENGAGKSTLIKILGGAHRPDAGLIRFDGQEVDLESPTRANRIGIGVIYQEFNLIPALAVWENIFLGRETGWGFVNRRKQRSRAAELFRRLEVHVPLDARCSQLSVAQQQLVEIVKALAQDVKLLVLDEPTAALTPQEGNRLLEIVRELTARGIGVIYISHRLEEIFQISERVVVLRDGRCVGGAPISELNRKQLIEMMVGREIQDEFPKRDAMAGEPRLVVKQLRRGSVVQGVSFDVRRGEVLGITGLVGAGRTETARLVFGADRRDGGSIELDGRSVTIRNPRDAIRAGICLMAEDRKAQGLVLGRSARENFGLPNLRQFSSFGLVWGRRESTEFGKYIDTLNIKLSHQGQLTRYLSGGNQQKIVLAKWLMRQAEVVIFDEPTRGIDVGTKYEIYLLINELARQGKSIIMISSELPEVLGICDRILVMRDGRAIGLIDDVPAATSQQIMDLAVG